MDDERRNVVTPGLCAYCSKPATRTCENCGQVICSEHTAPSTGLCIRCSRGGILA